LPLARLESPLANPPRKSLAICSLDDFRVVATATAATLTSNLFFFCPDNVYVKKIWLAYRQYVAGLN
jgi:hypothetical protein